MNDCEQPHRPPFRGQNRYEAFRKIERQSAENQNQIIPNTKRKNLFSVTITASTNNGGNMDKQVANEQQFLINLLFEPNDPKLRLRPAETQLLLSYIGEILREIEAEEKIIIEEEKAAGEQNHDV